ncbi:MAG: hypothetical protein IPM47_11970 [Sphingobacteriales bacterium]|nr:MAG: hypothetical protein IPM47_11970 [Sphingobacteriales bacterium]
MKKIAEYIGYFLFVLGLLLFIAMSYFGILYIFKGNDIVAFAIALLLTLALGGIVYYIAGAKKKEIDKGFTMTEGIGLFIYFGIALIGFIAMFHFMNVDFFLKDKIVSDGIAKVDVLSDMVNQYQLQVAKTKQDLLLEAQNHITNYNQNNNYPIKSELAKYGVNVNDFRNLNSNVENALNIREVAALALLTQIQNLDSNKLLEYKQVFTAWNRTQLRKTFDDLDKEALQRLERLQKAFKGPDTNVKWNAQSFNYPPLQPQSGSIISSPFELIEKYKPGWVLPILFALLIHFFILTPYLLEQRSGRIYIGKGDNIGKI